MEGLLLILVTGWLVWKYYTVVVAKPSKAERGGEGAIYNQYENNLDGFPYRREADGSVLVLTNSGEVRYRSWKAFYNDIRPDYQHGEETRQKRDAQQRERAKQERAVERLRRLQQEQGREAERLREQQEGEAERLRQERREQEQDAEMLRQRQRERDATPTAENEDWWTVLEVVPQADADAIQHAYYQKMKQCHPDRVAGLAPEFGELAERQAKRLNVAYRRAIQAHRARFRSPENFKNAAVERLPASASPKIVDARARGRAE
jgi:DnaJ-domain-containing protein 1